MPKYLHSVPTPIHPWHPNIPWQLLMAPDVPYTPRSPQCLLYHLYPSWPLSTYTSCQPPIHPWHPYTPDTSLMAPDAPWHPYELPMPPYATYILSGPGVPTLPASPPIHPKIPWWPFNTPDTPYTLVFYHVTLQLTIFMSMCSLQYTICSCQEYICSTVKLSQFLQYLPKHELQSSSCFTILKGQQSGLDMEIWLTPIRTSTYKRPFTQEGNYLVSHCEHIYVYILANKAFI